MIYTIYPFDILFGHQRGFINLVIVNIILQIRPLLLVLFRICCGLIFYNMLAIVPQLLKETIAIRGKIISLKSKLQSWGRRLKSMIGRKKFEIKKFTALYFFSISVRQHLYILQSIHYIYIISNLKIFWPNMFLNPI